LTGKPGSFFRDFKRFQRMAPCEHPIVAVPAGVTEPVTSLREDGLAIKSQMWGAAAVRLLEEHIVELVALITRGEPLPARDRLFWGAADAPRVYRSGPSGRPRRAPSPAAWP
jgi:hypothetical protein